MGPAGLQPCGCGAETGRTCRPWGVPEATCPPDPRPVPSLCSWCPLPDDSRALHAVAPPSRLRRGGVPQLVLQLHHRLHLPLLAGTSPEGQGEEEGMDTALLLPQDSVPSQA